MSLIDTEALIVLRRSTAFCEIPGEDGTVVFDGFWESSTSSTNHSWFFPPSYYYDINIKGEANTRFFPPEHCDVGIEDVNSLVVSRRETSSSCEGQACSRFFFEPRYFGLTYAALAGSLFPSSTVSSEVSFLARFNTSRRGAIGAGSNAFVVTDSMISSKPSCIQTLFVSTDPVPPKVLSTQALFVVSASRGSQSMSCQSEAHLVALAKRVEESVTGEDSIHVKGEYALQSTLYLKVYAKLFRTQVIYESTKTIDTVVNLPPGFRVSPTKIEGTPLSPLQGHSCTVKHTDESEVVLEIFTFPYHWRSYDES